METDIEPPSGLLWHLDIMGILGLFQTLESGYLILLAVIILLVLITLSGLISGSEVAFFSLTSIDLENLENEKSTASSVIIRLKQRPRNLLATILVANNFVNIGIVILSDYVLRSLFADSFYNTYGQYLAKQGYFGLQAEFFVGALRFIITVILVTSILVLFGEVLPKIYAKINNISLAKRVAMPLWLVHRGLYPITNILVKYFSGIETRLAKINVEASASKDEITKAIDLTISNSANRDGVDILKRIIKFGEVTAKEIMRPRVDVVALDDELNYQEVLERMRSSGFSRFPVYKEDFDNIIGILYVKDLLVHLDKSADYNWRERIRTEVKYVPEGKMISELIKEMQLERKHLVIVVDEFGGSSGIVTLEDVMEEVIGDIKDEFDDEQEIDYEQINEKTYVFEGKTSINDMCRVLGVDTDYFNDFRGDSDSVAGLILEIQGVFPKKNFKTEIRKHHFTIISANQRRIEKVQIIKPG